MTGLSVRRLQTAVLLVIVAGCAGPPALRRAIRPGDEQAYAEALAQHEGSPRDAFFAWKAQQGNTSVEEVAAKDAALSITQNPFDANLDLNAVSQGAVIYKKHCMVCHGENADGAGPRALPDHPSTNFHTFAKRFAVTLHRGAPKSWFQKISHGSGPEVSYGSKPGPAMPALGDKLSKEQIWLVITYLQSLDVYVPEPK